MLSLVALENSPYPEVENQPVTQVTVFPSTQTFVKSDLASPNKQSLSNCFECRKNSS